MKKETIQKLEKENLYNYLLNNEEREAIFNYVEAVLKEKAKEITETEPYATRTINRALNAASEVHELTFDIYDWIKE